MAIVICLRLAVIMAALFTEECSVRNEGWKYWIIQFDNDGAKMVAGLVQ